MLLRTAILIIMAVVLISGTTLAEGHDETRTNQAEQAKPKCKKARKSVRTYRQKTWRYQDQLQISRTRAARKVWAVSCEFSRWAVKLWKDRYERAKKKIEYRTLRDPGDWNTAIQITQRVFPGTASWLWNCSDAEGGHGAWVPYHDYGDHYYPGYEANDAVGGWMQFRPSTIQSAWPSVYNYLISHGWIVDEMSWFDAWMSPLAQALSAAYLKEIEHSADHHWSASVGNGC